LSNYDLKKNPNRSVKELIDIVELNPFLSYDKDYCKVYIDDVQYVDNFVKAVVIFFEKLDCKELNIRI